VSDRPGGRSVTVVVPTRNRVAVLAETLRSILDQRGVDVSVVVVDEGSTDGTPSFLEQFASEDPRVTFVRHDVPRGPAAARNSGIERVTTPLVAFCDDDDLWAPDKLRSQLDEVDRLPGSRWSCTGAIMVDDALRVVGNHRPPASGDISLLMRANNAVPGCASSMVAETGLVREVGGFDVDLPGCEDYDFAVKLALRSPVAAVDRPLVAIRLWPGSMSTDTDYVRVGHESVVARWRGDLPPALAREGDMMAEAYFGRPLLHGRRRIAAFRHFSAMAARFRNPRYLAAAVLGLAAPQRLLQRYAQRDERALDPAWRASAGWLSSHRNARV
jgi:glycosyltransferase involved in cell wall biosynthesis